MTDQNKKPSPLEQEARRVGGRLMRLDLDNGRGLGVCRGCLKDALGRLEAVLDGRARCYE